MLKAQGLGPKDLQTPVFVPGAATSELKGRGGEEWGLQGAGWFALVSGVSWSRKSGVVTGPQVLPSA